ncbi:MAG: hypothetical protein AAF944_01080 [Bacteroidota bacterium]
MPQSFIPTLDGILAVMSQRGYRVYRNLEKPFDINIVGIRSNSLIPYTFDDWIAVFYMMHRQWILNLFPATTDPGLFYLGAPINPLGTAILKEGQYPGMFELGLHRRYKALVQKKPVTVIRDYNRDNRLDLSSGVEDTGIFGINLHRASQFRASINVDKWSAGCQVVCDPFQFQQLLDICDRGASIFGNSFTYTLLHERDFVVSTNVPTATLTI